MLQLPTWIRQPIKSSLPLYRFFLFRYYWVLLGYSLLVMALYLPELIRPESEMVDTMYVCTRFLIHALIVAFLLSGAFKIANGFHQNELTTWAEVAHLLKAKMFSIIAATALYIMAIMLASKALVLPGIYIGIVCIFYLPFILMEDSSIFEAFRKSFKLVRGNCLKTFFLVFLLFILPGMLLGHLLPKGSMGFVLLNGIYLMILTPFIISIWFYWHQILVEQKNGYSENKK